MQVSLNWSAMLVNYRWTDWTILALNLCSSVLGLFGNLVICIVIACNPNLRSSTYTLICNMALSDTISSLVVPLQWHFCTPIYFDLRVPLLDSKPPHNSSEPSQSKAPFKLISNQLPLRIKPSSVAPMPVSSSPPPLYNHKLQLRRQSARFSPSASPSSGVLTFDRSRSNHLDQAPSNATRIRLKRTIYMPSPSSNSTPVEHRSWPTYHTLLRFNRNRTLFDRPTNDTFNARLSSIVGLVVRRLPNHGQQVCASLSTTHLATCYVSTLTMTAIAYSRYKLLHSPLRPHVRLRGLLIGIWSLSFLMALFATMCSMRVSLYFGSESFVSCRLLLRSQSSEWSKRQIRVLILFVTQYVLPFALTSLLYVRVLQELRSCAVRHSSFRSALQPLRLTHVKRISCTSGSMRSASVASVQFAPKSSLRSRSSGSSSIWPISSVFGAANAELRNTKRRLTHMLICVLTLFAFCWLPIHVLHLIQFLFRSFQDEEYCDSTFLYLLLYWLAMSTFAQNPFLYMYFSREIRSAIARLFGFGSTDREANRDATTRRQGPSPSFIANVVQTNQGLTNSRFFAVAPPFQTSSASLPVAATARPTPPHSCSVDTSSHSNTVTSDWPNSSRSCPPLRCMSTQSVWSSLRGVTVPSTQRHLDPPPTSAIFY
jgi:hypothetical protein